jgi:glycosyltransferase involved in cell wall biosynthesis
MPTASPTLVLNMIVKNESKIIERLLATVAPIIDAYCICDTGSTDDTKQRIETFMAAKGIRGEVFEEPFKNFGYNRTVALDRAARWGDYALLLDADMKLVIGPTLTKATLSAMLKEDGYQMLQGSSTFEYYNTRIVRTGIGVKCVSPTHEYYDFPAGTKHSHRIPRDVLRIDDIGDGGSKADKFTRDIRLLKEGLVEEPNNGRYHFYLANSHRDLGMHKEAIEYYKRRVALGGWHEEVWNSMYEMGKCYFALGDAPNAIFHLLEAYNFHPARAEPLHELTRHFREKGRCHVGQMICDKAKQIPYPANDVLFIKRDVYDYLLDYEQSILSYYSKVPVDHRRYLDLLGRGYNHENVLSNYQFYVRNLNTLPGVLKRRIDFTDRCEKVVRGKLDAFKSSSPCIIALSEGYLMNVRYVNYNLDKNTGSYSYRYDDQKIVTLNHTLFLNKELEVVRENWLDSVHREDIRYLGVEDVKVFSHQGALRFLGTVQDDKGRPRIGEGAYNLDWTMLVPVVYPSPTGADCEKNWVYFHDAKGALKTVYKWSPLTVGDMADGKFTTTHTVTESVPAFFRNLRGSTNGTTVRGADGRDEVWFMCHYVGYSTPRQYYHCIVVLDPATFAVKRHSALFKFEGEKIEYALGLVVESDRIMISYSKWDAESILAVYDRAALEAAVF